MKTLDRVAPPLLFSFLAVLTLTVSIYMPAYNWDMVAYIAAAKSFEETDVASLHSFTYSQLPGSVPEAQYASLVRGPFKRTMSKDASAFKEQLTSYQIRPIYTGLIYFLYKMGMHIVFATHVISGIAAALTVALLYRLSVLCLNRPLIYAVPLLATIFGILQLARLSTPDALASLAVILSGYLYLSKRIGLLLTLLPLIVGIRGDFILFTVPFLCLIAVLDCQTRLKAAVSILVSLVMYIAIQSYWPNSAWSRGILYFASDSSSPHPLSSASTASVQHYWKALAGGVLRLVSDKAFMFYVLIAAYSGFLITIQARKTSLLIALKDSTSVLAIVCCVFVVFHFLAFPVAYERFFCGSYLLGTFSFLAMVRQRLSSP
jgi:hypothetical protein